MYEVFLAITVGVLTLGVLLTCAVAWAVVSIIKGVCDLDDIEWD